MTPFEKEITLGWVTPKTPVTIHVSVTPTNRLMKTIDLGTVDKGICISLMGSVHNSSAGQCQDEIRELVMNRTWHVLAMPIGKIIQILDIWDRWHLNDINAASIWQREAIEEARGKGKELKDYEAVCAFLKKTRCKTDMTNHLYNYRGYKYGEAWLYEEPPEEVITFLTSL